MRRIIVTAVIIVVCFLLQCTVFQTLAIGSISPNLLIVVTASFGFMRGHKEGLLVGFFCGILIDLLFSNVIGFYALVYMFIGFGNGYFRSFFFPEDIRLPIGLIAASDFLCNLVIYFVLFWFRGRFSFGYYLGHTILPELVYTMLVAIVLYFILLRINQRLERIERKREAKFG
ncbi:MAG: rod shape-determining protein MreD [Lachnospiraceae bacterium]|nr:rod shape-determining protein MreD [Lachnospiraceae bacterium]